MASATDSMSKTKHAARHRTWRAKLRDYLMYCAIGFALIAIIIVYGNYQVEHKQTPGIPAKWLGLFIMTGLLLYFAIRAFRGFPDRRRFWSLIVIFGAGHFLAAWLLLPRIHRMTLGDFAIATIPEYFILMAYLRHFLATKA
jgi:cytochrome bd-type quinol oxidase subunit 2